MCSKEEEELGEDFLDVSKAHNTMQREWLWKNTYIVFTLWELSKSWRKRTWEMKVLSLLYMLILCDQAAEDV